MARSMPDLAGAFGTAADQAVDLAAAGERARVLLYAVGIRPQPMSVSNLELLYEFGYLRMFIAWEVFLEQSFLRYLCGYATSSGTATMVGSVYYVTLAAAETAVLEGSPYKLWHNPSKIISRAKGFIVNGKHEQVVSSNLVRLEYFAAIRHRIAHAQEHARIEFDNATMNLHARRYPGSRAGKFLRDWAIPPGSIRWLNMIADELKNLAVQIVS